MDVSVLANQQGSTYINSVRTQEVPRKQVLKAFDALSRDEYIIALSSYILNASLNSLIFHLNLLLICEFVLLVYENQ